MKKGTVVTISVVAAILLLSIAVYFYVKKQKAETEAAAKVAQPIIQAAETNKNDIWVAGLTAGSNLIAGITGLFKPSVISSNEA